MEYSANGLPNPDGAVAGFPSKDFIISALFKRVEKLEEQVQKLQNQERLCQCGRCF